MVTILYGTQQNNRFTLDILFLIVTIKSLTAWRGDAATVPDHPGRRLKLYLSDRASASNWKSLYKERSAT